MSIDVKIGVSQHPHEIELEMDAEADTVITVIEEGVASEKPMIWLSDTKGHRVGVIAEKIAFVEIRTIDESKRVGFGA